MTPKLVWAASNAMNYALVKSVAELLDRLELVRPYRLADSRRLGEELLAIVERTPDVGLSSDRATSERWAERLGFRDWLDWRTLDALPAGFRHAWE